MDALTQSQGAAIFGDGAGAQISYQQYQMLQTLRRLSEQARYYCQKDVVGYDQDKQADSLLKWFNIRSMMEQIIWLAMSAISVMAILVFFIWQRRRKRWHPADLPLAQLSKRLSKADKALARHESEGQLAWLERLAMSLDTSARPKPEANTGTNTQSSSSSQLVDSNALTVAQMKIEQIKQDYRQLRYGRLSTIDMSNNEYQQVLKQLKNNVRELPRLY